MLCRGLSGCKGFFSAACGKKCGLAGPCGRATVRMGAARPALPASGSGIMAAAVSKAHAATTPAMKPQKQCSCPAMPRCGLEKPPAASAPAQKPGKTLLGRKKTLCRAGAFSRFSMKRLRRPRPPAWPGEAARIPEAARLRHPGRLAKLFAHAPAGCSAKHADVLRLLKLIPREGRACLDAAGRNASALAASRARGERAPGHKTASHSNSGASAKQATKNPGPGPR